MKMNWNEYKDHVKQTDPIGKEILEEAEAEGRSFEIRRVAPNTENRAALAEYKEMQNNPEKYAEFISAYNSAKKTGLIKFGLRAKKCWKDFCKKYHFSDCMHTYSPWGRSEMLIESIKTIKKYSDDWVHVLKPNEERIPIRLICLLFPAVFTAGF